MLRTLVLATAAALAAATVALAGPGREPVRPPTPAKELTIEQLLALPVPPNERYYVIVFGSQSTPKIPRLTHTWATVVRLSWADGQAEPALDTHTISWMPATLRIRTFSRTAEPGVNLGMQESIDLAHDMRERVSIWGPYEIRYSTFQRVLVQKAFIESGAVGYQCIDKWGEAGRCGTACDCIHAVSDMDPEFNRSRYPLRLNGEDASENIVEQLARRGALPSGPVENTWVRSRLGLDCPGIIHRCYNGPVNDMIRPDLIPLLFPSGAPTR
jgi:hypothetical protein